MAEKKFSFGAMKALFFTKSILTHRYLALALRLYIGGLFIYASMYKINYTPEFAEVVASYQVLPYWAVNIFAVVLPWVELVSGVLLIAGIRTRSAALTISFMMAVFTVAVFVNLLRDAPISCGCFQAIGEKLSWGTLARDVIWITMTVHVLLYDRAFQLERKFSLILREI